MFNAKRTVILATIAGVAAVCITAALHAEPEPTVTPKADPAPKAEPAPEAVLGGPRIPVREVRPTLVSLDSQGKLVPLDERPEIVAVGMIGLSGDAKKAADKVLNEHGAAVSKALNEHQAIFLQIQSARQSGDQRLASQITRELRQKAPQLWEPPLLDQLAKAIPVEKAVQLRSIVNEYLNELAKEGAPGGDKRRAPARTPAATGPSGGSPMTGGDGDSMMSGPSEGSPTPAASPLDDPQTLRRIENNLVVREMARSLKSLVEMRREQTDRLLAGLGLTPEQDAQIRKLIHDTGTQSKDARPSQADHRALIEQIKKLLTVEQQQQLAKNMQNR